MKADHRKHGSSVLRSLLGVPLNLIHPDQLYIQLRLEGFSQTNSPYRNQELQLQKFGARSQITSLAL